jgi:hypothetical protein
MHRLRRRAANGFEQRRPHIWNIRQWISEGKDEAAVQVLRASSTLMRYTPASLEHEDMDG